MNRLKVTVGCGQEACEAKVLGKVIAKRARGRKGKQAFKVKPKTVQIAAGERQAVRVKLQRHKKSVRELQKLLRRATYRKGSLAMLRVNATDPAGNSAVERLQVRKLRP